MGTDPEPKPGPAGNEATVGADSARQCGCTQDPFAGLPPESQPKPKPMAGDLRHVTCPDCGLLYWTNRATDLCMDCAKGRTL
jgi:hypothetical protein